MIEKSNFKGELKEHYDTMQYSGCSDIRHVELISSLPLFSPLFPLQGTIFLKGFSCQANGNGLNVKEEWVTPFNPGWWLHSFQTSLGFSDLLNCEGKGEDYTIRSACYFPNRLEIITRRKHFHPLEMNWGSRTDCIF